jgi:hypothetical protein
MTGQPVSYVQTARCMYMTKRYTLSDIAGNKVFSSIMNIPKKKLASKAGFFCLTLLR